jgi:hypothetical protein
VSLEKRLGILRYLVVRQKEVATVFNELYIVIQIVLAPVWDAVAFISVKQVGGLAPACLFAPIESPVQHRFPGLSGGKIVRERRYPLRLMLFRGMTCIRRGQRHLVNARKYCSVWGSPHYNVYCDKALRHAVHVVV